VLNALTIDVEEWFHVCGVPALGPSQWDRLESRVELTTRVVLELLDETDSRATFFVLGWVAERHPQLVADIRAAGHQIGSHGHLHQRAYDLGETAFREDLRASVRALEVAAMRPVCYRAPEWSINERSLWALEVLASEGFVLDASMAPVKIVGDEGYPRVPHVRNTPSGALREVPPFVVDRWGRVMPLGWGWALRMSAPGTVLAAIAKANQAGLAAVLTVHPWELDPLPPRVRLPPRLRFAHYFRLSGFRERLRGVLRGASFQALDAAVPSPTSPAGSPSSF
jgi:polysaccharide deacetylase family protein (PEP-CTERM system associated)